MSERLSESVNVTNPKTMDFEIGGVNVSIGKILGDKLVDEVMTRITPEELEVLFRYMKEETWKQNYEDKPILNYKTNNNSWNSKHEPPVLATYASKLLQERLKLAIQSKVEEIVASEEFIKKADDIAQELVDYATEGYKKDMKDRLRARLVGNITDGAIYYDGCSLIEIIRQEISNFISAR